MSELINPDLRKRPARTKMEVHRGIINADPPICRPNKSPWSSDVVLVNKKNGNVRFVVDHRRLNAVMKRD